MTTIDPEKQKQAKQYSRIKRRLLLADTLFGAAYLLAWLFFGWSSLLRDWINAITKNDWLIIVMYFAVFGGVYFLLNLPLGYYSGFILPHRFDQSNQTLKSWIVDQLKGLAIGIPLGLLVIELIYLALRSTGALWWLWVAGGLLLMNVLLANLAPVLILPLFNKFIPLGDEHKELEDRLLKLAERANTKVKGVFKFDMSKRTKSANAALMGLGNTRRIVLGDTLINEFTPDEIETVLAHELGHQVHNDIAFLITFGTLSTTLGLYLASLAFNYAITFFGFASTADVAAFPALVFIMSVYSLIVSPIDNAFSRWRENMADDYALQSTRKDKAFASGFTRLANQNLSEVDPEKWVVFMFYSHPPLGERIEKAKQFASS